MLIGEYVQTEVKNNKGRADAIVKTADSIYLLFLLTATTHSPTVHNRQTRAPATVGGEIS